MHVGITGAGGFIGTLLLEKLRLQLVACKTFEGDLLDVNAVEKFTEGCELVIHLAGIFSNDFDQLIAVNVLGTKNVSDSCKKNGVSRLIFSSTGAVYGEPLRDGISSEDDPLLPNTLYGLSKLYAEEYIRFSGIPSVILRFPNVYGPGNNKGVIYNFLKSISEKKEVTIFGSGEQKRNFLFVDDAVRSIILAIGYSGDEKVFNISDKFVYSLNDVVSILKRTGLSFDVRYLKAEESNALQTLSEDISKSEKVLCWSPAIDLEQGIKKIIESESLLVE